MAVIINLKMIRDLDILSNIKLDDNLVVDEKGINNIVQIKIIRSEINLCHQFK